MPHSSNWRCSQPLPGDYRTPRSLYLLELAAILRNKIERFIHILGYFRHFSQEAYVSSSCLSSATALEAGLLFLPIQNPLSSKHWLMGRLLLRQPLGTLDVLFQWCAAPRPGTSGLVDDSDLPVPRHSVCCCSPSALEDCACANSGGRAWRKPEFPQNIRYSTPAENPLGESPLLGCPTKPGAEGRI